MLSTPTPQRAIIFKDFPFSMIALSKVVPLLITTISASSMFSSKSSFFVGEEEISIQSPIA